MYLFIFSTYRCDRLGYGESKNKIIIVLKNCKPNRPEIDFVDL